MLGPERRRRRPTPTCCASARCSKTLGALGGFVAGPAPLRRADRELEPAVHLHDRADAGRHRGRARRARASCARPRATRSSPGCARNVDRLRPGHPSPILPFVCGDEQRALDAAAALLDARPRRARDPAADRRAGHLAPARHARAPRTPTRRSIACSRALADVFSAHAPPRPRMTFVVVAGTGTEVGKTWVTAALAARAARAAASRSRRASRCSRSHPTTTRRPTPTCSRAATGEDPHDGVPGASLAAARDGAADGRRRARLPPFTIADLAARDHRSAPADARRARRERGRRALPARRRRRHRRARRPRCGPRSSCSSPTPGSARSTSCG